MKTDSKRIILLDFLRGALMIWVMFDHFLFDAGDLFYHDFTTDLGKNLAEYSFGYECGLYRKIAHPIVLLLFFLISGIVFNFSRSKVKRSIKLIAVSVGLFIVTKLFSVIFKIEATITCGVIEVFAVSSIISVFIDKFNLNKWILLFIGLVLSVFGILFKIEVLRSDGNFYWFVFNRVGYSKSADYFPLFPYIGYYLVGVFISKTVYSKKRPLIKVNTVVEKILSPVSFIGKTSLWWYLISQAVFVGFFYLVSAYGIL